MRKLLGWCCLLLVIVACVAPPVDEKKKKKDKDNEIDQQVFDVEYQRYLQEVVNVLESDDDFKQRLIKADPEDIKSGKISNELEFVNHNVRSKLDELKRQELERLRQAAIKNYELANGVDKHHMKMPNHIDHSNPHTFEAEDLKKLILQTTRELEEVDKQRKDEFKEYEMRKELEYQEQLKRMDDKNKVEAEKFHKQQLDKHRKHEAIHHPGSKQQLEQVWEEQDHMSPEDFNPKTFFHLHDLDGNGVWDANEVKALFKKELDKMYDPNASEDDIRERYEEMERMREHVFNETDTNRDQLISYQEFLDQTRRQEFQRDEGWDPIDQQQHPVYNEEEYQRYAKQHEAEIRRMMEQGLIPQAPQGYVPMVLPPGAQVPPGYQVHPQGYQVHSQQGQHQGQQMQYQGQHPQQIQGQGHPQGAYHAPPSGVHPNAIPQDHGGQQYHPQGGQQLPYQQHPQAGQQQMHYQPPPPPHQVPQDQYHQQQQYQQAPPYQQHPSNIQYQQPGNPVPPQQVPQGQNPPAVQSNPSQHQLSQQGGQPQNPPSGSQPVAQSAH